MTILYFCENMKWISGEWKMTQLIYVRPCNVLTLKSGLMP